MNEFEQTWPRLKEGATLHDVSNYLRDIAERGALHRAHIRNELHGLRQEVQENTKITSEVRDMMKVAKIVRMIVAWILGIVAAAAGIWHNMRA